MHSMHFIFFAICLILVCYVSLLRTYHTSERTAKHLAAINFAFMNNANGLWHAESTLPPGIEVVIILRCAQERRKKKQ